MKNDRDCSKIKEDQISSLQISPKKNDRFPSGMTSGTSVGQHSLPGLTRGSAPARLEVLQLGAPARSCLSRLLTLISADDSWLTMMVDNG